MLVVTALDERIPVQYHPRITRAAVVSLLRLLCCLRLWPLFDIVICKLIGEPVVSPDWSSYRQSCKNKRFRVIAFDDSVPSTLKAKGLIVSRVDPM